MPRLFVDVDGTLIDDADCINAELQFDISCFLDHHEDYGLVVWSGGGVKYATTWALRVFPETFPHAIQVWDKDLRTPFGDDIVVDDMYGEIAPRDYRVCILPPDGLRRCPLCISEGELHESGVHQRHPSETQRVDAPSRGRARPRGRRNHTG